MPTRRLNTLAWHLGRRGRVRHLLAGIDAEHPRSAYVLGRMSPVTYPWYVACCDLGLDYTAIAYGLELVEALTPTWAKRRVAMVDAAKHWFVISHDTSAKLAALGVTDSRQSLLLPGVAMPAGGGADDAGRHTARQRLGLGEEPFILSLCHLRHRKGIDLAVEAFAAVADEFPALRYVAAGSGPEYDALNSLARATGVANRVFFPGAIDEATKAALFAECEFFVLPTRAEAHDVEGFGIVYLEAGSYGKAVIGGANGGVAEAIADGETGILVDSRDAGELVRAMRTLLRDPARRAAMGREGAKRARRDFSWAARGEEFATRTDEITDLQRRDTPNGIQAASPAGRMRRRVGSASNRTLAAADILGMLARRGRLGAYLSPGVSVAGRDDCARSIMAWIQRAISGGGGEGASARYHVTAGWAGPYPEITGYLISTLLHYAAVWDDPGLEETAVRAGEWLARTRIAGGAICRKQWYQGNSTPSVFNTAQVIEGWCALASASRGEVAAGLDRTRARIRRLATQGTGLQRHLGAQRIQRHSAHLLFPGGGATRAAGPADRRRALRGSGAAGPRLDRRPAATVWLVPGGRLHGDRGADHPYDRLRHRGTSARGRAARRAALHGGRGARSACAAQPVQADGPDSGPSVERLASARAVAVSDG